MIPRTLSSSEASTKPANEASDTGAADLWASVKLRCSGTKGYANPHFVVILTAGNFKVPPGTGPNK